MAENRNNKIAEIAEKILDVEIDERFKIETNTGFCNDVIYYFNEYRLVDEDGNAQDDIFVKLLNGYYRIIRQPYKPKPGRPYYSYYFDGKNVKSRQYIWTNCTLDILLYKNGFCYRTENEANVNMSTVIKYFTSIK